MKIRSIFLATLLLVALTAVVSCKDAETVAIPGPEKVFGVVVDRPHDAALIPLRLYLSARGYYVPLHHAKDAYDRKIDIYSYNDTIAGDSVLIVLSTKSGIDADGDTYYENKLKEYAYIRHSGLDSTEIAYLREKYGNDRNMHFDSISIHYKVP